MPLRFKDFPSTRAATVLLRCPMVRTRCLIVRTTCLMVRPRCLMIRTTWPMIFVEKWQNLPMKPPDLIRCVLLLLKMISVASMREPLLPMKPPIFVLSPATPMTCPCIFTVCRCPWRLSSHPAAMPMGRQRVMPGFRPCAPPRARWPIRAAWCADFLACCLPGYAFAAPTWPNAFRGRVSTPVATMI